MVAVNSLLYFLLSAGLSGNPEQPQEHWSSDALSGIDIGKLCPSKEHLSECEAHCQKNCTNYNKPIVCPRICVKGCVCNEGLVRGADGKCILPKQCPGKDTCPRGQHYVQCNAHCQWNCTNYGKPIACPRICVHGCVCDRGTVRGPKGRCIKPDSCPKKGSSEVDDEPIEAPESFCPVNEIHSKCLAHCQRDCSNWDDETFTCTKMCSPGCICERGLVRGPDGTCIKPKECTPKEEEDSVTQQRCPRHEKYSPCSAHCQKNCKNYKEDIPCTRECRSGCVCEDDMVRGPDGKCVYPNDCPWIWEGEHPLEEERCPIHEKFSPCTAHCQTNCSNYKEDILCTRDCHPGCICQDDMVRGPDGKCIYPNDCPWIWEEQPAIPDIGERCPPKEHLSDCEAHCQKNCSNYKQPVICPKICIKGCVCDEGLVRGVDGKCILPTQCPKERCPIHEKFSPCTAHCQKNCSNYKEDIPCTRDCNPGCICQDDMVRGPDGKCIYPNDCPWIWEEQPAGPIERCPRNEKYSPCSAHCQKNCRNYKEVIPCTQDCNPGCVCRDDMVRGPDGKCIYPHECSREEQPAIPGVKCPAGEIFSLCRSHCQKTCSNWDDETPCRRMACKPGCVCDTGMVRGPDGKCIWHRQCPHQAESIPGVKCPAGEIFSLCRSHCQKTCSNWDDETPCRRMTCKPGCVCDTGMVRGPDGKCIWHRQCPHQAESMPEAEKSCPPKEHLSECGAHCQKNCTNFDKPIVCPAICVKGCVCDKGLVRGKDGKCVPPKQCPGKDVCPRGEHYDQCNAHCQRNCSTWGKPLPCPLKCEHGCVCDRGTVRGPKGKCIRPDKCPKKDRSFSVSEDGVGIIEAEAEFCPDNEEYSPCNALCEGDCINSEPPCMKFCVSGCKCKKGFVRGTEGKCIKEEECKSKDYPRKKVCPENEIYLRCGAVCQANCTNVKKPTPCPKICIPGCLCKIGLIRGDDGKCIPRNKCPKSHSDDEASQEDSTRIYKSSEVEDSTRLDIVWPSQDEEESTQGL